MYLRYEENTDRPKTGHNKKTLFKFIHNFQEDNLILTEAESSDGICV